VPSGFLSAEQVAAYGRYAAEEPSRAVLERFFFLDDADGAEAGKHRGDHNRLGYAVQLMTVRHLGRFLPDVLDVPAVVVDYVAEQVGAADPSCLKQYVERRATRFEHQAEIVTVYGYVSFATARDELAGVAGRSGVDQRGRAACAVLRGGAVAASAAGAAAGGHDVGGAGRAGA